VNDDLIGRLLPPVLHEPEHWEKTYPQRELPAGAQVTRFGPSPTGFVHIGGIYTAMVSQSVAHNTGGVYVVRIEDTDQTREVAGAVEQFSRAFDYFGVASDEVDPAVPWGPYHQSARGDLYLTYVRELLRTDQAYPCFCTREELDALTERQRDAKGGIGYFGEWATCRDLSEADVAERIAAGRANVIRFKAPPVEAGRRVTYDDVIRGPIEQEDNIQDIVVLKSSDAPLRLPTYHLAHVVDDHLMRITVVTRGEEWISSVPVHLQLFAALGFEPIPYAHIAPLMKVSGSSRRKLSKRHDPEASVDYYLGEGYPRGAVLHYLRGLANSRLADLPFAEAAAEPIRLEDCNVAGAMVDLDKLADIGQDYIAELSDDEVIGHVDAWATEHDPALSEAITAEADYTRSVLAIRTAAVKNIRKDLAKWSDFRPAYGFFYPSIFEPITDPTDERLGGMTPDLARQVAADFVAHYRADDDRDVWFEQIRELAARNDFAANKTQLNEEPDRYHGLLRDVATLIRVLVTGASQSPDLFSVSAVLGADEITRRVAALTNPPA
jgi:glutamyl-tRNA synthetase